MKPLDFLHLQLNLEGKRSNDSGSLEPLEDEGDLSPFGMEGEGMPLAVLAQTSDGKLVFYPDAALPENLRRDLISCANEVSFRDVSPILKVLDAYGVRHQEGHYKTYTFPEEYLSVEVPGAACYDQDDPRIHLFGFNGMAEKVYAVELDGKIISACVSVRQNSKSAEAWIFTLPEHRRKGRAVLATSAWAQGILRAGLVPFYSHKISNTASASLARYLGLVPLFEEIGINRPETGN